MTDDNKKARLREAFREFAEREHDCKFGQIPPTQLTRDLAKFYIFQIHNPLKSEISEEDFDIGFVDGAGDLDVDFIHRDDGRVLVLQSRYHGNATNERAEKIERFHSVLTRLHSARFKSNTQLSDILGRIDWERDSFELVYVTLAAITGQALEETNNSPRYPVEVANLAERYAFEFYSEERLQTDWRRAATLAQGIPDKSIVLVSTGSKAKRSGVLEVTSGNYRSCVMAVEASQLVDAHNKMGDALFTLNIRNFLGNTRNNQRIINTAKDKPDHFFYFNNGISCLAEKVEVDDGRVTARKLQVINGAQTVKGLVRAAGKRGKADSWEKHQPVVLVRITEVGSYGSEASLREDITKFNNTQNVIRDADFRSNDAIQADVARQFADIRRPTGKIIYQAKRTDIKRSGVDIIRMEPFTKVVYAFLGDPVRLADSTAFLFDEEDGYAVVFGNGKSVWKQMPEAEFRLRAAVWWLTVKFEEYLKSDKRTADDQVTKNALERKWFPLFVTRLLLQQAFDGDAWKDKLGRLYKGDWLEDNRKVNEWVQALYKLAKYCVVTEYRHASQAKDFAHRNWQRSNDTTAALRAIVKEYPDLTTIRQG